MISQVWHLLRDAPQEGIRSAEAAAAPAPSERAAERPAETASEGALLHVDATLLAAVGPFQ